MKKLCFLLSLATIVGLGSCSRDFSETDPTPSAQGTHSLKASIAQGEPSTRTGLGDKDEENGVTPLLWVAGDQIAVIDDANPNTVHQYILDPAAAGQSEGTFTVSEGDGVQGAASITAYYPYSFYSASQGLSIPAIQQHKEGRTMETDMLPMYAHSSGAQVGELDFHPVAGLINLQLTKNDKLNESRLFYSVKLVSTQDNLAGKGSLADDSEGYKILTIDGDDASKEITFSLSESGLALKEGEITSLMFVVPAKTYSASTLKFVLTYKNSPDDADIQTIDLPVRSAVEVQRGHIVNFAATDVGLLISGIAPEEVKEVITDAATSGESEIPQVIEVVGMDAGGEYTIELPTVYNETENQETISLVATDVAAGATILVQETAATGIAPQQYVSLANATDNSCNVAVELPNSTVTLDGTFDNVEATTADQTLIIPSGTVVQNLTVKQGSVKIYGTVKNLTTAPGWSGEIVRGISSQECFDKAMENDASINYTFDYALIDRPIPNLDGKGQTLALPLKVSADATISNLTIRPSESIEANGITILRDSVDLSLNGVDIYVSSNNSSAGLNTGVLIAEVNNVTATLKDCHIVVPKSYQRGINMHSAKTAGTTTVTLDNTHIGPTFEPLTTDYSHDTYTQEQIDAFKGRVDSRGVSFGGPHSARYVLNLRNGSVIEGVFYAINFTYYAAPVEINVDRSIIDGRCAFNIWANGEGTKINVTNGSKLVGRNYFPGPTEVYANIVIESKANGQAAENNVITVRDSEFHCFNEPQTNTNWQYAVDVRSEGVNTLQLLGETKIYDHSGRLPHAIDVGGWSNRFVIDPSVSFAMGKEGATILPTHIWDGSSFKFPGKALDGKYYIGEPSQLAVLTLQVPEGMDFVLVRDLDLNNHPWLAKYPTSGTKANTVDGGGHTIYNLNTGTVGWDTKTECPGLFSAFAGTIKDLTIENATVYGSRAGALAGRLDYGTITNCHVKNVTFIGGAQKMAGLIGFINGNGDIVLDGCSVDGCLIVNDPAPKGDDGAAITGDASCMAGGLVGFIQSFNHKVDIRNCSVKNTTVQSGLLWDNYSECTSHEFIGNIANTNKYPNAVFTLTNNAIEGSSCDAKVRMNDYFGFCYTGETGQANPYARVVVDGEVIVEGPSAGE